MPTSFIDVLSRTLTSAGGGLQDWLYRIKPMLDEQSVIREERKRAAQEREEARALRAQEREEAAAERRRAGAQSRVNFMMTMARGDPQRAFTMFGRQYAEAVEAAFGTMIPTRTVPAVPGQPERVETDVTVLPKTQPTAMESYRAGERGQAFVPKVYTKEHTIPAIPGQPERTELDLPAEPQPAFKTIGDLAKAVGRDVLRPESANIQLDTLPSGFNIEALFKPLPDPPKRIAIYDQTTGKWQTIEAPPGTDLRITSSPKPDKPVPIVAVDAHGNARVVGVAPPGSRIVQLPKPPAPRGGRPGGGGGLTASQRSTLWRWAVEQATAELPKRRGAGLTLTVGPDGEIIPQMGTGQSPLTPEEIQRIQARAEQLYQQAFERVSGRVSPQTPISPRPPQPVQRTGTMEALAQAKEGGTAQAQAILRDYRTTKIPIPRDTWNRMRLTQAERRWLLAQGVKIGP